MEYRKKSKGPVILVMLLCMALSLWAGVRIGRSGSVPSHIIQNFIPSLEQNKPSGDAPVVELQPLPEYTDGGYDIVLKFTQQCV